MKKHGGKRKGSGRKKGEPTKVIRVPESMVSKIKAMIKERCAAKFEIKSIQIVNAKDFRDAQAKH